MYSLIKKKEAIPLLLIQSLIRKDNTITFAKRLGYEVLDGSFFDHKNPDHTSPSYDKHPNAWVHQQYFQLAYDRINSINPKTEVR